MPRFFLLLALLALPATAQADPAPPDADKVASLATDKGMVSPNVDVHTRASDGGATLISMSVVQVDVRTVLRALAKVSGAQLVLADDVPKRKVTVEVERETPQRVFYAVLAAVGVSAVPYRPLVVVSAQERYGSGYWWPNGDTNFNPSGFDDLYIGCF